MKFAVVLSVFAVVVLMQAAAADSWMQPRGDAAATGFQEEDGPEWPDVALHVQLEGSMRAEADTAPLILEDRVLFLARPYDNASDDDYRIFSVDFETSNVTIVAEGIERASQLRMATDGDTVYITSSGAVHALPLEPEGKEWTWSGDFDADVVMDPEGYYREPAPIRSCGWMAVQSGNITILCSTNPDQAEIPGSLLVRLDATTGQVLWFWDVYDPYEGRDPGGLVSWPAGLAVDERRAIVLTIEGGCVNGNPPEIGDLIMTGACTWNNAVWAIETENGELDWSEEVQSANWRWVIVNGEEQEDVSEREPFTNVGNPAISDGAVYVKAGQVFRLNIGDGGAMWNREIGREDVDPESGDTSGAVSIGNGYVYTASAQTFYGLSQDDPEEGWSRNLDFSAQEGFRENPVATPSAVYTVIASPDGPETIVAFSTEDGGDLWRHEGGEEVWALSVGQGLIAYTRTEFIDDATAETSLVILGETDASPVAKAVPTTRYPGLGEAVEVDLSASEAGLQGPVTRYKAIWGDGTETDWQESPVLTHLYTDEADMEARFIVGNDANQTASTLVTFHVGADPPPELNFLQKMFAPERQDMTFGVLGVLVALTGGAIGVTHRHRKKNRLKDVLDSVERAFAETSERPLECESQLTERKTHARGLVMDGELDENQFQVVESRIEELRTSLRLSTVEKEFELLPHGVVRSLEEMLKDGRVSTMERDGVLAALEEADGLTPEYKDLVRSKVNEWYSRDHGEGDVSD